MSNLKKATKHELNEAANLLMKIESLIDDFSYIADLQEIDRLKKQVVDTYFNIEAELETRNYRNA